MAKEQEKIITVRAGSGASAEGRMFTRLYEDGERTMRAAKALGMYWLIALLCVLIPVAHFVLVPGFLVAGVVAAKRKKDMAEEGLHAQCVCPACGKDVRIDLEHSADIPQWRKCPECSTGLELVQDK
ncbi:MAG: hypothetical protein D6678_05870 [Zetaproteobacteria bacterium]|nr:MAG: hypothetical protein D6678_05870 [Zetaproteobacteria bacterium]